jgi:hypothetical protein
MKKPRELSSTLFANERAGQTNGIGRANPLEKMKPEQILGSEPSYVEAAP